MTETSSRPIQHFDAATWRQEDDPVMRSTIMGLMTFDTSPDWERMRDRFDRTSRTVPVLRERLVSGPIGVANPRLTLDPHFDLDFHLRRMTLPEPGNWNQLIMEAWRISREAFDPERPLWRAILIEGMEGGKAALVLKLNHSVADGQGAVAIGANLFDLTAEGQELGDMPPEPTLSTRFGRRSFVHATAREMIEATQTAVSRAAAAAIPAAQGVAADPRSAALDIFDATRSVLKFTEMHRTPLSPEMRGRTGAYTFQTLDVPLDELKAASKAHGMSVNDAFVAAITGGMRHYHERKGKPVDELRANIPISLRKPGDTSANAVTIARMSVPVSEEDPVRRMNAVHELVAGWKEEKALEMIQPLSLASKLIPVGVITMAAKASDFTASNIPGLPIPVYLAGAQMERMYPLVATIGAAVNITLVSYNGVCCIGISSDREAVDDPKLLLRCLKQGFDEVCQAATPATATP